MTRKMMMIKKTLLMVLMMTFGTTVSWGQAVNYSGTYYIESASVNKKTSGHYYLCPTEGWIYYAATNTFTETPNGQPFLTTYQCKNTEGYETSKALWKIEKSGDYYTIKNVYHNKYIVYNGKISDANEGRIRVHLEDVVTPTQDGNELFVIGTNTDGKIVISPKDVNRYFNVCQGNINDLAGSTQYNVKAKNDGPTTPTNHKTDIHGTIGLWTDKDDSNAPFYLEIPAPTFSLNNDNKVEITALGDADIYYTTNGSDPVVPAEGEPPSTPTQKYTEAIDLVNGQIMVKAIATNKDHHVISSSIATYVYNPNITWSETSFVYNGTAQTPTEISVKIGNIVVDDTKYSISCGSNTNAGSATLTLSDKDDKDNYYIVNKAIEFTIAQLTATLTWTNTSIPYNKTQQKPTATVGNLVTGDACSVTVTVPDGDGITVGEYMATASELSNTNYALPTEKTQTFNIVQKDITISGITAENKVYDKTTTATLGYTGVTFGGLVSGDALTITATGAFEDANAGTEKTVNISGLVLGGTSIANYKLAETEQQTTATADITKKDVTVTSGITAENKVYDGTTNATFVCSSAVITGLLEGDNLEVTSATGTFDTKDVGEGKTVTITGFTMGGTSGDNYKAADTGNQESSTANITQLEAVLAWSNDALTYNTTAQVPTATVSNAAEGDNVTVTVTGEQTNVGENYTATATALSDTNYKLPTEGLTHSFTIAPVELTVIADAQTKVYGDDDPTLTYTATGFLGSETADIMTGALARTEGNNVGEYDITQGTLAAPNYTITFTGAKLTITAASITITADNKSKAYGATDPTLTFTVDALKYSDTNETVFTGELTREEGEEAGTYAINQGDLAIKEGNNNYTISSFTPGTFTIIGEALSLTVNLDDWVYGSPKNPSVSGNAGGGKVTYTYKYQSQGDDKYTTTKPKAQGNYTVRAQVPATGSYEAATATKNFKITKLALKITADSQQKDYLDNDPELTYTANLKYDDKLEDVVECELERAAGETVGEYAITIKDGTTPTLKSNNYSYNTSTGYTGAKLTITAKNIGNGGTPALGITISAKKNGANWTVDVYNGNNKFDAASDFDYTPPTGSDTDGYTITVTGKGNNCYGSATSTYNNFNFPMVASPTEKAAPYYVADKNFKTSADVVPCIVSQVNPSVGTISIIPISYVPKGVPVLLLAKNEVTGLMSSPLSEGESSISESLLNSNKLMYNVTEAVTVHEAEAYMYYLNEFVLTLAGTIKAQNYYIYNPNYTGEGSSTSSSLAPTLTLSVLNGSGTTGIMELNYDKAKEDTSDRWYSLDGRRLNSKPTQKGIYIKNGKKTVVK